MADVPEVLVTGARQSRANLAAYLKTTVENLARVNPRLPDPVPPGTLVVIPLDLVVSGGTLYSVAVETGLTVEAISAVNPDIPLNEPLAAGHVLVMPTLIIAQETVQLSPMN